MTLCKRTITFGSGERRRAVEKKTAEAFLTTAETDWHQQIDAEPNKNLSADGRCYFVTGADSNKSLGTPERQVWDIVRVETTGVDKPGLSPTRL